MVNISKLNKYLSVEDIMDGDTINFCDPGLIIQRVFKNRETGKDEPKDVFEITVDYKGDKKTFSPNKTSQKLLKAKWGDDTEKWVGKSARLHILPTTQGKDMVIAKPIDDLGLPANIG